MNPAYHDRLEERRVAAQVAQDSREAPAAPAPPPCVLVVDDEPEITRSVAELLGDDYRVLTAHSCEEALELLRGNTVSVILTDQRMPGGNGAELLARCVGIAPEATRILFSAYSDMSALIEAVNDGDVYHFIAKPWRPEELKEVVGQGFDRYRLVVENRQLTAELEKRVASRTVELEITNRELESFAYSVSHDLRAPLRAIDGFTQMVIEDASERLDATDVEHLERARGAAQRMASLIDDLLALSRATRVDLQRRNVDLSALVDSVAEELREAEPERCVELTVVPGMQVMADPAMVRVILFNLLGNAWKFTGRRAEAHVHVGESDADGEHTFFVRDDGAGFDAAGAQRLFGAFQRFHSTQEFEGNGIGLATVRRLVHRHGGRVWVESQVGSGATFFFTLPETTANA